MNIAKMLAIRVLFCSVLVMAILLQQGEASWIRIRWPTVIAVAAKCYLAGCFSRHQIGKFCEDVTKATIKREEWQAIEPRYVKPVNDIANEVIFWHTGSETCRMFGLSGYNCQKCIQDEHCLKKRISAIQNADLSGGMDDIKYHFLIGQDGVIYEGRGWGVAGAEADHLNAVSMVSMIGDFHKKEPNQASLNALKNLITCGQSSDIISEDFDISTTPEISGEAFFAMIRRCNGLCTDD
ncbi:hypothetical protein LSH36_1110g00034 [Paralvinella palmiformis]|uniref:Peptidoglycan recognition protein family domain-containing protein n=1 Tax=Paralvinella palmiformis TaxID=53620 RepID=A0AAD9IW20_9ANNE|nr:hypothetical protein LSH36_1110g00034 [Paralvinella palmiformis]